MHLTMKKTFCVFGLTLIFLDSLVWVAFSSDDFYRISFSEFAAIFIIGFLLMLPELIYQLREFVTSGTSDDVPF